MSSGSAGWDLVSPCGRAGRGKERAFVHSLRAERRVLLSTTLRCLSGLERRLSFAGEGVSDA